MADLTRLVAALPLGGRVKRRDLLEKDIHMNRILSYIREDSELGDVLVFKGGSCLVKAYLGYYRFSEDLDFTWRDQDRWAGLSTSRVRRDCSELVEGVADGLEVMAADLGMKFLADKTEPDLVSIGSGGRMVTFFLYHTSNYATGEGAIKVQLSFVEELLDPVSERELGSFLSETMVPRDLDELGFRFGTDVAELRRVVRFPCYSPRELFLEKCRAVLTRRGLKHRDLVDIAMLERHFDLTVHGEMEGIVRKTAPMLRYRRYRRNLDGRPASLPERIPELEGSMLLRSTDDLPLDRMPGIYEELLEAREGLVG